MMIDFAFFEKFLQHLDNATTVLVVSHVGPDGDAVGSLLGMGHMLLSMGKKPTLALQDADLVYDEFAFLPGVQTIVGTKKVKKKYDLIICLDASSEDRMGTVYQPKAHANIPLAVIDHHFTNTRFGDVNWVAPECAATCQMLVYLADALAVPLSPEIVTCLLTGIVTDTHCMRTSNTDANVLEAVTRLMNAGGNLSEIVEQTLDRRPYSLFRLWGQVMPNIQLEEGVIWVTISRDQLAAAEARPDRDARLSSFLVSAIEADISASFIEKVTDEGELAVECSFRAKPGFNVGRVAHNLGGGGHPQASGCTIVGDLDEITTKVVSALKDAHREQVSSR
ncbi:MAG: bifunctional oligoribonuclease/PAP phosphatase NrnA [Chloroflexota bacterium]